MIIVCLYVLQLEKTMIEPADILHLFRMVLQSIQIHGQHEAILPSQIALGLFMYEELVSLQCGANVGLIWG